jgi:PAS fold
MPRGHSAGDAGDRSTSPFRACCGVVRRPSAQPGTSSAGSSSSCPAPSTSKISAPPDEWRSDPTFFARVLHPDDRDRVLATFALAHKTHQPVQIEYRVLAKDGRVVWIQDDAAVAHDDNGGQPRYFQGFMVDITERRASPASATASSSASARRTSSCGASTV